MRAGGGVDGVDLNFKEAQDKYLNAQKEKLAGSKAKMEDFMQLIPMLTQVQGRQSVPQRSVADGKGYNLTNESASGLQT